MFGPKDLLTSDMEKLEYATNLWACTIGLDRPIIWDGYSNIALDMSSKNMRETFSPGGGYIKTWEARKRLAIGAYGGKLFATMP